MKAAHKLTFIIATLAFGIIILMEACSPFQAITANRALGTSSSDVCAEEFRPVDVSSFMKTAAHMPSPFEHSKLQLSSSSLQKASNGSLKGQELIFTLNMDCDLENSEIGQLVLNDNVSLLTHLTSLSLPYTFTKDINEDELYDNIEADTCIIGVSRQGSLTTASLPFTELNDPKLGLQPHFQHTNYLHAFDHLVRKQNPFAAKAKIAFIDTGADCNHIDLKQNLASDCGYDITAPGSTPNDNDGHGTHTLGLVAAVSNNSMGVSGMGGYAVEAHAIKVIGDSGTGTASDAANGISQAVSRGADIINISLESEVQLASVESAVYSAVSAGVVVIMAAGNHSKQLGTEINVSPAMVGPNLPGAITVGSVDAYTGRLSQFSNYGSRVEIATIGALDSSQNSIVAGLFSTNSGNNYQRLMGTSQAAPIIAAAASLLIQFFKQNNVTYTPANIENIILASSDSNPVVPVAGNRVFNFSKLVRNAHLFANINLCD